MPIPTVATAPLQSTQMGGLSPIYMFMSQCLPLQVAVTLVYFTDKQEAARRFCAVSIAQGLSAVIAISFAFRGVKEVWNIPNDRVIASEEFKLTDIEKPPVRGRGVSA
jgi:F0F1-type ATP synthase assembly protein I